MKKVDEGVELFDEIWEKVYSAEQQNQKEKYEMDLKKEIKKLQRLRDQIKAWISGTEVKEKESLIEARKLIETKMEQFKICEKETKTKMYSKEGLAREEQLSPEEQAKQETVTWCQDYIDRLHQLVEEAEFEIEKLQTGKGKKTNKSQIEDMQTHIAHHKFHISKLEGIIRLVNNDRLDYEPVDQIREDFDYYFESYKDEDYRSAYDEDIFYESLGLDELDIVNVDHVTQASTTTKSDDAGSFTSSKGSSKEKKSGKKPPAASVIPLTIGRARLSKKEKEEAAKPLATPAKVDRVNSTSSSKSSDTPPTSVKAPSVPVPAPLPALPGASMAAILKRDTEQQEREREKVRTWNRLQWIRLSSTQLTNVS